MTSTTKIWKMTLSGGTKKQREEHFELFKSTPGLVVEDVSHLGSPSVIDLILMCDKYRRFSELMAKKGKKRGKKKKRRGARSKQ